MSIPKRTLIQRFFPGKLPPGLDFDEDMEQKVVRTTSVTVLDWKDRFRVLVSGKVMMQTAIVLNIAAEPLETVGRFQVLPPNYPITAPEEAKP